MTAATLDDFHRLVQDDHVRRYLMDGELLPREWSEQRVLDSAGLFERCGVGLWLAHQRETGDVVGFCGLLGVPSIHPQPQLVYAMFERFTGQGYATEMARASIAEARRHSGFSTIVASVDEANVASVRVLEKLGFRRLAPTRRLRRCARVCARDVSAPVEPRHLLVRIPIHERRVPDHPHALRLRRRQHTGRTRHRLAGRPGSGRSAVAAGAVGGEVKAPAQPARWLFRAFRAFERSSRWRRRRPCSCHLSPRRIDCAAEGCFDWPLARAPPCNRIVNHLASNGEFLVGVADHATPGERLAILLQRHGRAWGALSIAGRESQ